MKQANKWVMRVMAGMVAIGVAPFAMAASESCVSTTSELNGALVLAQFAPQTIKLVQGSYRFDQTVWHDVGDIFVTAGSSLRGGYTTNCAGRDIAAGNTVLTDNSASDAETVLLLGDLTLEGLTFHLHNGLTLGTYDDKAELSASAQLTIRRSVFENSTGLFALSIGWQQDDDLGGDIRIVDTLISGNPLNGNGACALDLYFIDGAPTVTLINDTIVDNSASGACFHANVDSAQGTTLYAYNNVFWGNSNNDLDSDSSNILLVDNTIGTHTYPTPLIPPVGTLTGNPQLDASFRPVEPGSPAINSGTEDVSGGLPATDLDGRARVIGGTPDRGAYESNINNAFVQTVTNTNDSGGGSLREAMINANAASGFNIISFDIGSSCGPHVITLDSPLPSITSSVFINGYSQTGSSQNDLDSGDDAVICVILTSGDASASTGLRVGSSASTAVYLKAVGMAFSGFSYAALDLKGGSDHVVAGNHFGGSVGGVDLTASQTNIWIGTGVSGATVGGDDVSQRNIISGALGDGIHLDVPSASQLGAYQNQIINNYIGTTHTGNAAFGNGTGINIGGDHNTMRHNLIAGNTFEGVWMSGAGAHNNVIDTNDIGSATFGNGDSGVRVDGTARDNMIISNTITNNGFGVRVVTGVHNRISRNSISLNDLLGIDLAAEGVSANDDDGGVRPIDYANDGLNFPVLTQATGSALSGIVSGTLTTEPGTYTVELFVNSDCDVSAHGEGTTWRRTINVTILEPPFGTGQGTAAFTTSIKPGLESTLIGKFISSTTSSTTGDTSEFSACRPYANDTIFADTFE